MQGVLIDGILGPDVLEIECPCSDLLQVQLARPSHAQLNRILSSGFVVNIIRPAHRFYMVVRNLVYLQRLNIFNPCCCYSPFNGVTARSKMVHQNR